MARRIQCLTDFHAQIAVRTHVLDATLMHDHGVQSIQLHPFKAEFDLPSGISSSSLQQIKMLSGSIYDRNRQNFIINDAVRL